MTVRADTQLKRLPERGRLISLACSDAPEGHARWNSNPESRWMHQTCKRNDLSLII